MPHRHPPDDDRSTNRTTRTASTTGRDRGVSELLGAILVFGLLIAVLVVIQANAVPDANKQLEFQHNERVQGDFVALDADLADTAETGRSRTTVVETGLRYPPRFFLFNPPPVTGALTTDPGGFTLRNARAVDEPETDDYWTGTTERNYDSRTVSYAPAYNVYAEAPTTTYAYGTVINEFPDGTVRPVDDGSFVSGRTISLIALDGDRDVARTDPVSLEARALSAPTRTVRVTDEGGPIVIRVETPLSAGTWAELLADEPNVVDVTGAGPGSDAVDVTLRRGVTYDLRLAELGVGPTATDPGPAYLTAVTSTDLLADVDRAQPLTVEVRNAFNGPEPGVPVTFTRPDGSETVVTTDDEGRATLRYAPDRVADTTVVATADIDDDPAAAPEETVTFEVSPRGSGDDDTLNPIGSTSVLRFVDASVREVGSGPDEVDVIDITFDNRGTAPIEITSARVNFYFAGAPGSAASQPTPPEYALVRSLGNERLDVRGPFVAVSDGEGPWTIETTPDETLTLEFFKPAGASGDTSYEVNELDFLVLTLEYEDGRVSSYIVAPESATSP